MGYRARGRPDRQRHRLRGNRRRRPQEHRRGRNWITALWRGRFMGISALVVDPTSPLVVYAAGFQSGPSDCGIPGPFVVVRARAVEDDKRRKDVASNRLPGL